MIHETDRFVKSATQNNGRPILLAGDELGRYLPHGALALFESRAPAGQHATAVGLCTRVSTDTEKQVDSLPAQ